METCDREQSIYHINFPIFWYFDQIHVFLAFVGMTNILIDSENGPGYSSSAPTDPVHSPAPPFECRGPLQFSHTLRNNFQWITVRYNGNCSNVSKMLQETITGQSANYLWRFTRTKKISSQHYYRQQRTFHPPGTGFLLYYLSAWLLLASCCYASSAMNSQPLRTTVKDHIYQQISTITNR